MCLTCARALVHFRRGANIRSPVVAETSGNQPNGLGGTILTEDNAILSADSEGEAEYSLAFDNESMPGSTVVGIDGMDQDNLLMDVTLSFYEMGIRYITQTQLAFGLMLRSRFPG
jgi:hypothetical protein